MKDKKTKKSLFNFKKAQVDQIFIYTFSIIMILFAGFLVTKFITSFDSDVEKQAENKFYNKFNADFYTVYTGYGSEKIFEYKISNEVTHVCFIKNVDCLTSPPLNSNLENIDELIKADIETIFSAGDNLMMLDKTGVISSKKSEKVFYIESGDSCLCIEPDNGRFEMVYSNLKNKVYISENIY